MRSNLNLFKLASKQVHFVALADILTGQECSVASQNIESKIAIGWSTTVDKSSARLDLEIVLR